MKKEFYFRSSYELVTNIMSETQKNCSIAELKHIISRESKSLGESANTPMSIYSNIHCYCIPMVQQMEMLKADLFMSVMMRCTNSLSEDTDANVETLEQYVRSILGLDNFICEINTSNEDPIRIGFHYELSGSTKKAQRMKASILLDAIESIIQNYDCIAEGNYPMSAVQGFRDQVEQIVESHGGRIEDYDPLKEARDILGLNDE